MTALLTALRVTAAGAGLLASIAITNAAEPPAGASSCSGCHPASAGVQTLVPRLNGRPAAETIAQMAAFRTGQREATVMGRIAKGFTDAEIQAIAAWYARQR